MLSAFSAGCLHCFCVSLYLRAYSDIRLAPSVSSFARFRFRIKSLLQASFCARFLPSLRTLSVLPRMSHCSTEASWATCLGTALAERDRSLRGCPAYGKERALEPAMVPGGPHTQHLAFHHHSGSGSQAEGHFFASSLCICVMSEQKSTGALTGCFSPSLFSFLCSRAPLLHPPQLRHGRY